MPSYATGSAKQDPETKAIAVRTIFPDMPDFADRQWGVMTVNNGGHYCSYEAVSDWPDVTASASSVATQATSSSSAGSSSSSS